MTTLGDSREHAHLTACLDPLHPGPCKGWKGTAEEAFDKVSSRAKRGIRAYNKAPAVKGLKSASRRALLSYVNGSGPINRSLRHSRGAGSNDPKILSEIDAMDRAMADSKLTHPITVQRAISPSAFGGKDTGVDLTGAEYIDHAFGSTGTDLKLILKHFHTTSSGRRPLIADITVPAGMGAIRVPPGQWGDEKEVLLDRGAHYRVVKDNGYITTPQGKFRHVTLEVVPGKKAKARQVDLGDKGQRHRDTPNAQTASGKPGKRNRFLDYGPLVQVIRTSLTACLAPLHYGPCAGSHHKGFLGIGKKRDESVFHKEYEKARASGTEAAPKRTADNLPNGAPRKALRGYTSEGTDTTINGALREGKATPEITKLAENIDKTLGPTSKSTVVYRGINSAKAMFGDAWKEDGDNAGLEWVDNGFTSTSFGLDAARNHGDSITMHIVVPKGTHAIRGFDDQTGYDGEPEEELLLQRGMHFRIVEDHKRGALGKVHKGPYSAHERTLVVEAVPPMTSVTASITLMQSVCTDGQFCMLTHKPGLCKGQKRGQTEPGQQDATKQTPAQVAQTAVDGLGKAIAQATAVAQANVTANPKLAAMAKKAVSDYRKALKPHQQTLQDAAKANSGAARTAKQDARQQDTLDRASARAKAKTARQHETLEKRAAAIKARRAEQAKLKKMTPKQRSAYRKAKSAAAHAKRTAAENKTLKDAAK